MPARIHLLPAALLPLVAAVGQVPPGSAMPRDLSNANSVPEQGAGRTRWQAGRDALAANKPEAAREHLAAALQFHPAAAPILLDAALASANEPALLPLWVERFVRAAADAQGRLKPDQLPKKANSSPGFDAALKSALELASLRSAAVIDIQRFVERNKPTPRQNGTRAVLVRWAAELLLELGQDSAAGIAATALAVDKLQNAFEPDHELIFTALARLLRARTETRPNDATGQEPVDDDASIAAADRRIRAARILVGLRRQAKLPDLQGPPGRDPGRHADEAARVLAEHDQPASSPARVWTVAELAALSEAERERFTREHRDWRRPGTATSLTGKYRIETICGYHSLLGVAQTIELHHERLVSHYGKDPFGEHQGLVRIVPEQSDMETEGTPYWWAGGFQAGDRTTVRFAWGNLAALGRTLTHELTHRFDGVLKPFLGAWYGEGHASWTGGHYAKMTDQTFVEEHLQLNTVARTYTKGYGDRGRFEQLLKGDLAEYRDNYFAGYSLYAFLRNYPPGAPRYRSALAEYERNARAGANDPVGYFAAVFADGKAGRPKSLTELHQDWEQFLRGCYDFLDERRRGPDNQWVARYVELGPGDPSPMVLDEPTWSWARAHAEPFFGQEHAMAAALLLQEAGEHEGALAAGLWSLSVDGWRPETATAILAALQAAKQPDAAQAFAVVAGRRFPQLLPTTAPQLPAALPKVKTYIDALATRAQALAATAAPSAAALQQDHARLARLIGMPALPAAGSSLPEPLPRQLGSAGYQESKLFGYDDQRVAGLWYASAEGDLHVGREKPRETTGTLDRQAHQRDAFAHSQLWIAPGDYVVRGRVHLTTAYARGAIVIGHTRRDRGIHLHFHSGDFDYATGRSEAQRNAGKISFRLSGLWEREGHLPGGQHHFSTPIASDAPWFDFALQVRGPRLQVEINGEAALQFAVHDGSPIEGPIGFATGMGAIRVQQAVVQRRDDNLAAALAGLDLTAARLPELEELLQLPVRGIPHGRHGSLVLWLPTQRDEDDSPIDMLPRALPVLEKLLAKDLEHPQDWLLLLPQSLPQSARDQALQLLAEAGRPAMPLLEHSIGEPFTGRWPWVLFIDRYGILRAAAPANEAGFYTQVERWSRLFRSRRG